MAAEIPSFQPFFHPMNFLLQPSYQNGHNQTTILPSEFHPTINHSINRVEEDVSDDDVLQKKRRLSTEQVKTLEKNFELGSKLEPERKLQLAGALGLQPRQVAIWFQNRRARWKTKQLEKDYELLKRQLDAVKSNNSRLREENQKLQAEILALKNGEPTESINLNKETEGSCSDPSENSSKIKLDMSGKNRAIASRLSMNPGGVVQCPKMEQSVKEESLCNVFCGVDDQTIGFWPWLEQQHNFN